MEYRRDQVKVRQQVMSLPNSDAARRAPFDDVYTEVAPPLVQVLAIDIPAGVLREEVADGPPVLTEKVTISPKPLRRDCRIARISIRHIDQYLHNLLAPT
jgi:hypothetical protein